MGDFGVQGNLPSHPELLDWLAVDFMENGWDIKRLVKKVVMSSTYTQSAVVEEEVLEKDANNVYLSRMPRLRLLAEHIRDLILASSGLLNREIGGPSVKPYQPDGLWNAATSGRSILQKYVRDHGTDLYRRGMYTFIKRTVPPPVMLTFDASNRDQCEVNRYSTNTLLQALIMLNDPTVLESSRVLAERLIKENEDFSQQVEQAFKLILNRKIKEDEKPLFVDFYQKNLDRFETKPDLVEATLNVGEYRMKSEDKRIEIVSLMQVIHMIYNLDEAIVKS